MQPGLSQRPTSLGWLPPASLAIVVLGLALVFTLGGPSVYHAVARVVMSDALPDPFLDTHAVIAAIECHHRGYDVLVVNPCDVMNRPHVYSPLWLHLGGASVNTGWTMWVGTMWGAGFVASAFLLPRMDQPTRVLLMALALLSPGVVIALERGNNDLIVFIIVAVAVRVCLVGGAIAGIGYGLASLAALLKFYPVSLAVLALREPPRRCLVVLLLFLASVALYGTVAWGNLRRIFAIVPVANFFNNSFGAVNLIGGLHALAPGWPLARTMLIGMLLLACMANFVSLLRDRDLPTALGKITAAEAAFFLAGGTLVVGCFIVTSSHGYRAVFLPMLVPALSHLAARYRRLALAAWLAALLPWAWLLPTSYSGRSFGTFDWIVWLSTQCLWWWLISTLAALLLMLATQLPAGAAVVERLGWPRHYMPR